MNNDEIRARIRGLLEMALGPPERSAVEVDHAAVANYSDALAVFGVESAPLENMVTGVRGPDADIDALSDDSPPTPPKSDGWLRCPWPILVAREFMNEAERLGADGVAWMAWAGRLEIFNQSMAGLEVARTGMRQGLNPSDLPGAVHEKVSARRADRGGKVPDSAGWWRIAVDEDHEPRHVHGIDDGWGEPIHVGRHADGTLIISDGGTAPKLNGLAVAGAPVIWGAKCEIRHIRA